MVYFLKRLSKPIALLPGMMHGGNMKSSQKKKFDMQVFIISLVIVFLFGSFFALVGFAFYRMNYVKSYVRQTGVNLTGNLSVYAEVDGNAYRLGHDNSNRIARILVVGTMNLKRSKDVPTGEKIVLTSVDRSEDNFKRTTVVERLENDRVMVTHTNEYGSKRCVLDDVTFFSIKQTIKEGLTAGENIEIDSIP